MNDEFDALWERCDTNVRDLISESAARFFFQVGFIQGCESCINVVRDNLMRLEGERECKHQS
jgi:hypothetical protein